MKANRGTIWTDNELLEALHLRDGMKMTSNLIAFTLNSKYGPTRTKNAVIGMLNRVDREYWESVG